MKTLFKLTLILLLLTSPCWGANTVIKTGSTVSVVPDGSTAFDLCAQAGVPSPVYLEAIIFKPSAANDKIQVRDGSATGAIMWPNNLDVLGGGQVVYYNGVAKKPYIVQTGECTFGTPANAVITFIYRNK
jgi:hypothetical protein